MSDLHWHSQTMERVLVAMGSNREGLSAAGVSQSRQRDGRNILPPPRVRTSLEVFVAQFRSPLIYILFVGTGVAWWLRDWTDGAVILAITLLNAIIGWRQEFKSSQAAASLAALAPDVTHVYRDGLEREIPTSDVVVGDIVTVQSGDRVPADGRWIQSLNVRMNEASLTGESSPVTKHVEPVVDHAVFQEQRSMAWRGTTVASGRGQFVVTSVGRQTRFGSMVSELQVLDRAPTPFQEQLAGFSQRLLWVTIGLGVVLFLLGWARHLALAEVFLLSVSLIVAVIPEGLPVVITLAMTWGMWAMARRRALVRQLNAVETLGAVTTIASDKTGTLTYGEMMVERIHVDGQTFTLTGRGYAPEGDILYNDQPVLGRELEGLSLALRLGAMNNDGHFTLSEHGQRLPIGDPTELALIVAAGKAGWSKHDLDMAHPRLGEIPFDSNKQYMMTWHQVDPKRIMVTVKGGPRTVLEMCQQQWTANGISLLSVAEMGRMLDLFAHWADDALRGLALAYVVLPLGTPVTEATVMNRFIFVGLVGQRDAIRPEAAATIARIRAAGIRVLMMTGDARRTGVAVAKTLGLLQPGNDQVISGRLLDQMSDQTVRQLLRTATVATRLTPEHKLRLGQLLKQNGEVVAMTGDGINDVPLLLEADVGVAVGPMATDAAKEASDMVLLDGDLQSLTVAIAEGRRIFRNIKRVMYYLLASNFGELLLVMAALLGGLPLPLLPTHIIWLNAITDPFLGVALVREPASTTLMRARPHQRGQAIVDGPLWGRIVVTALTIAGGSFAMFMYALSSGRPVAEVHALTLTTIALAEWLNAWTARSSLRSVLNPERTNTYLLWAFVTVVGFQLAIIYLPILDSIFHLAPLSLSDWGLAILGASPVLIVEEIKKWWLRQRYLVQSHQTVV